jgi:hypothetical protein
LGTAGEYRQPNQREFCGLLVGGGGDRNDKYFNKARALNALQPPTPANWNNRNKIPG